MNLSNSEESKFKVIIAVLLLFTFFPFFKTGFTTNDDTIASLLALSDINHVKTYWGFGVNTGRITTFLDMCLSYIPYMFDNVVYKKVIQLGSVIFNYFLFLYTLNKFIKSNYFVLFIAIFFLSSLQTSWEHNLLSSYPFIFQLGFSLVLISLLILKKYLETNKKKYIVLSVILYFFTLNIYEMFLIYFPIYIFIVYMYKHNKQTTTNAVKTLLFYLSGIFVYFIVYFVFTIFYPPQYDGVKIDHFSFYGFIRVLFQYTVSASPSYFFFEYKNIFIAYSDSFARTDSNLLDMLYSLRVEWIVKSILVFYSLYVILNVGIVFKKQQYKILLFISSIVLIFPAVLPSLTKKYQAWVTSSGSLAYTITYFSYFGVILLLTTLIFMVNEILRKRKGTSKIFIISTCSIIALISTMTDYSNYYVVKSQSLSQYKWNTVDYFIKSKEFEELPNNSIIYTPTLFKYIGIVANPDSYWSDYFKMKGHKNINVINKREDLIKALNSNNNIYYLKYSQEPKEPNQFLVFSKITKVDQNGGINSDRVFLYSYSKNKTFNLFGNLLDENDIKEIYINNQLIAKKSSFFSYQVNQDINKEFTKNEVDSKNIIPDSVNINYYIDNAPEKIVSINTMFKDGFSDLEGTSGANWRWSGPKGTLILENVSEIDKHIEISSGITTGYEKVSDLEVSIQSSTEVIKVSSNETAFKKQLTIPAKSKIEVLFQSNERRVNAPNDPRTLVFRLNNFTIYEHNN